MITTLFTTGTGWLLLVCLVGVVAWTVIALVDSGKLHGRRPAETELVPVPPPGPATWHPDPLGAPVPVYVQGRHRAQRQGDVR